MLAALTAVGSWSLALPQAAAAQLTSAAIAKRGQIVELRFRITGTPAHYRLSAQGNQLQIDLPNTVSVLPPLPLSGRELPPLVALRATPQAGGALRLMLEVEGRTDFAVAQPDGELLVRLAPARAGLDLTRPAVAAGRFAARAPAAGAPGPGAGAALRSVAPAVANRPAFEPLPPHPLVMIDPGHGGEDPGTVPGPALREKDLALAIALRLSQALRARGVRTELTRATDRFVPLGLRTLAANRAAADVFVSIHLNSSRRARLRGVITYYLDNTNDRATIRLARLENRSAQNHGGQGTGSLDYILSDLRQAYKANESAALARLVEREVSREIERSLKTQVPALGARKGPFYVLVGARMPAVLIECGFLSNPAEARLLATAAYQQALAEAIAAALVRYLHSGGAVNNL